jgi:hypothetical protein
MRALVIDGKSKEDIQNCIKYAENHRYPRSFLVARMNGKASTPGDNNSHNCYLHDGFKVVFSIEEQPFGWAKHLSVSIDDPEKMPSVEAVKLIMSEFGIKSTLDECEAIYIEDCFPKAVNIISKI